MAHKPEERFAYGSVLEALSRGLYPDKRHVIREFIQNSYDGLYELRKTQPKEPLRPIELKIQPPSIFIGDYGIGMSEKKMREYRYLGYSEKEPSKHAGFRGIGKYSSLAVTEKIIVDSSPYGVPERFQVVIDVGAMIAAVERDRNPPLERVLRDFTELKTASAPRDEHYTFVELRGIRKDAEVLFEEKSLKEYLACTAPVPLDPEFTYASTIQQKLLENISDFLAVDLHVNGEKIYRPYFANCREPEYENVLYEDDKPDLLAFCWYCENAQKGQFELKERSGLVYRIKNIAVGDGQLTRRTLWHKTPERAFYFFGEIHILDADVIPSSDRTDFEDNQARDRLYERCVRIASILSRKAGEESARRRFYESLAQGNALLSSKKTELQSGQTPVELQDQIIFEVQKHQEDIRKRSERSKDDQAKRRAKRFLARSAQLLQSIRKGSTAFFDLQKALKFDDRLKRLYDTIIEILKEEFHGEPSRLARIIRKIHQALKTKATS